MARSEQLDFVVTTIGQAHDELWREGLAFEEAVPLGVMLETAAALPLVDDWARRVDYFALGTNDLTSSALGLDRDDPVGTSPGDAVHPGLLRLIHTAIRSAHSHDRPITVCGELAADPIGALALTALGIDACSVPVDRIALIRHTLSRPPSSAYHSLSHQLPSLHTSEQVCDLLQPWTCS